MSFFESLFMFREPGFVGILFICFIAAFFASAKARPGWQLFIAAYCTVYIITKWSENDHFSMGLWWMYFGWAGFLFHKLGGMPLLAGIGRIFQNKFHAMGREPMHQQAHSQRQQQAAQSHSSRSGRSEEQRRQQEEYRQREWQREQRWQQEPAEQFAQAQRQAEEEKRRQPEGRQKSTRQEETPPKSKPKPDPEPKRKDPPPPKPAPKRTLLWWEVLEVSENADQATIKKAYRTLIQKYHPDRVSHLGEEFQAIAEEKTKEINGAFDKVKKK